MKQILKPLKWFVLHIEEIISVTAITVMLCAIFLNVMMRYLFRAPTAWADELSMICLAYVTYVGGAAAYKRNLHFGIDILVEKLPIKGRTFLRQAINLVFIVLFAYLTVLGYQLFDNAKKVMNYTGWSYKIMDAAFPLGFLSMTIYAVYFFIQSFTDKEAYQKRYETTYEEENVSEDMVKASAEIFQHDEAEKEGGDAQ